MTKPIAARLPFVWPEPRVSSGVGAYTSALPFEDVARGSRFVFGIVSSIDAQSVNWVEGYLADGQSTKVRLIISIYPACLTSESDLMNLLRVVDRHGDRAEFRVYPEASLLDRSSNLLCLTGPGGDCAISLGPTENMGFATASPSHANLASAVSASTFEACRKWFDYLWGVSGHLTPEIATSLPHLRVPQGDLEAAHMWDAYRAKCLSQGVQAQSQVHVRAKVDPESGDVVLIGADDQEIPSPTEAIGVQKLDPFGEALTRLFELGSLVSVDKLTRIPPLEAPVKPEWFGVDSFRQTGMVRAQTSIKVAPFDETTLKKIDRLRRVSGELLPRFSFALADGVRWIPKMAIPLFEAALSAANEDAKKLLGTAIGDSVDDFLTSQRGRIREDAQRMYAGFQPGGIIPDSAVSNILEELKRRLDKTKGDKLIPRVAYSPVAFNPSQTSEWSSPWGQAFALLKGVAEFPREAMTNRFFWQGLRANEIALVKAMDVAGDYLVEDYGSRKAAQIAEGELDVIGQLEEAAGEPIAKCRALWALIKSGDCTEAIVLIGTAKGSPA